jgi:hypothetical protein
VYFIILFKKEWAGKLGVIMNIYMTYTGWKSKVPVPVDPVGSSTMSSQAPTVFGAERETAGTIGLSGAKRRTVAAGV